MIGVTGYSGTRYGNARSGWRQRSTNSEKPTSSRKPQNTGAV